MNKQSYGLYVLLCALLAGDIAVHCVHAQKLPNSAIADIRTHQLELVNWNGTVTAKLYNGPNGAPVLMMYDQDGRGRLLLTAQNDGTGLSMHDAQGKPALQLGAGDPAVQPAEVTLYSAGIPRVDLHSGLKGGYGLTALDSAGNERMDLEYRGGESRIAVFDKSGNERAGMEYHEAGDNSSISVGDEGKQAQLSCDKDASAVSANDGSVRRAMLIYMPQMDKSMVVINDRSKSPIWSAPISPSGSFAPAQ